MDLSERGLQKIQGREGCKLKAYTDAKGVWTIGYGHTGPDVHEGLVWTQMQADDALYDDLEAFEKGLNTCLKGVAVTQSQFDALVSFTYNIGLKAFRTSTMLKKLRAGNVRGAAEEFEQWERVGDNKHLLASRRMDERSQFLQG